MDHTGGGQAVWRVDVQSQTQRGGGVTEMEERADRRAEWKGRGGVTKLDKWKESRLAVGQSVRS